MAGKSLQDVASSVFPKSVAGASALCDLESKAFLQATGRQPSDQTDMPHMKKRRSSSQLPMRSDSVLPQQPSSTSSSQQEHGSLFNHMPAATCPQTPMAPTAAVAAAAGAGMRTQLSAATRCRQASDDGEEVTSLPISTATAAAAVAAAFATAADAATPAVAAAAIQPTTPSTPSPSAVAVAAADPQQQQQQQQQQSQSHPLPPGCRVLLSKALTRSDANAKRVILRCKQVEASLGSRPVGQGHKLCVGLPCGGSCSVMVRAWANGSNAKPMYVLEQVDQLFKQQQLAAGDTVELLVSADGRQHFLRWLRAGEAAAQLPEPAAASAVSTAAVAAVAETAAATKPVAAAAVKAVAATEPAAAVAEPAVVAPAAEVAAEPAAGSQPEQAQQQQQQQQQQVQSPQPVQSQAPKLKLKFKLPVAVQQPVTPQQQLLPVQVAEAKVLPAVAASPEQQQQPAAEDLQQQQQDDQDAALLLLPLMGCSAMEHALRTGCYLLCLQPGCMQPACLGCMSCCLHKRRRLA